MVAETQNGRVYDLLHSLALTQARQDEKLDRVIVDLGHNGERLDENTKSIDDIQARMNERDFVTRLILRSMKWGVPVMISAGGLWLAARATLKWAAIGAVTVGGVWLVSAKEALRSIT